MRVTRHLARAAFERLFAVDSLPPLQRHVRLLVVKAYLEGALECVFLEGEWPGDTPENDKQRETKFYRDAIIEMELEVNQRRFGTDPRVMEQWAASISAGLEAKS